MTCTLIQRGRTMQAYGPDCRVHLTRGEVCRLVEQNAMFRRQPHSV